MAEQSVNDTWSLGCDVVLEDENSNIQQMSMDDIILEGSVVREELSVNIDHDRINVMDLDLNVIVDGLNPAIVESQIVSYDDIVSITDLSPESTAEKRYASSAKASKIIHDNLAKTQQRVEKLENDFENMPQGGGGGTGIVDMVMSDTSTNAVANKVIKAYADLSPKYKVVGEVTDPDTPEGDNPGGGSGGSTTAVAPRMQLRHIDKVLYVYSDTDLAEAAIQLGRLGRSYSGKRNTQDNERNHIKKNGWRIYNHETKGNDTYNSDTRLKEMRLIHSPRLDFYGEYRYAVEFVTDDFETTEAAYALASSFGRISSDQWFMSTSHGLKAVGHDSSPSQIFAVVINGTYLPLRLFMQVHTDGYLVFGLSPL